MCYNIYYKPISEDAMGRIGRIGSGLRKAARRSGGAAKRGARKAGRAAKSGAGKAADGTRNASKSVNKKNAGKAFGVIVDSYLQHAGAQKVDNTPQPSRAQQNRSASANGGNRSGRSSGGFAPGAGPR